MLVQDMLTGQLHDIPEYGMAPRWPDPQVYGLGEVHDERGNSLGVFFLPKLVKGAVSAVNKLVPRAVQAGCCRWRRSRHRRHCCRRSHRRIRRTRRPGRILRIPRIRPGLTADPCAPPKCATGYPPAYPAQRHRRRRGGRLHAAPGLSEYDMGEVVYDGLGNPVALVPPGLAFDDGFGHPLGLPFLAPFLPAIASAAKAVLPRVTKALPGLIARLAPQPVTAPVAAPVAAPAGPPPPAARSAAPAAPARPYAVVGPAVPGSGYPIVGRQIQKEKSSCSLKTVARDFCTKSPDDFPGGRHGMRFQPPWRPPVPGAFRPAPPGWAATPAAPFTGTPPRRLFMRCSVWPAPAGPVPPFATQPYMPGMPGMPGLPGPPQGMQSAAARRQRRRLRRRR